MKKNSVFYSYLHYKKQEIDNNLPRSWEIMKCRSRSYNVLKDMESELMPKYYKEILPRACLIEITNACNLNCSMCNTKMSKRPIGFIEPSVFEKILQQLNVIGIKTVGLHTVGEPFMYKGLEDLLKIAERNSIAVWLSTNGQFPGRIEQLYRQFPNSANIYRFSIDGAIKETYESIRRGASFDRLIDSLEVIHRINNGKRNSRIMLAINSILSMTNIFEIPQYFKVYGKYCWPKKINFNLVNGVSPDSSYFRKEFNFPGLIRSSVPCKMLFESIYFTYSGKATLCCRDYEEDLVIGDIRENSIVELWNSPRAEKIREMHGTPDILDIRPCRTCFVPYNFVSAIMDEYIHYLHFRCPKLTPQQFGDKLLSFLNNMNSALQSKKTEIFRKCVREVFKCGY